MGAFRLRSFFSGLQVEGGGWGVLHDLAGGSAPK
jgi:hypothetical protein